MAMEVTEYAFPMDAEECEEGFDREYVAADFARYFSAFITSGIIADGGNIAESLQVVANDDMTTTLKAGNLIINGYRYELMKDMVFQHRAADGVLDRIDRISITLDTAEREIHAILREGEYSYQPIAPQCRRSSEYMDYVVADVRIVKGAIKITQANITDTRLSTELCGIAFPFWRLDTGPFFAQLDSFYEEFVLKSDRSYDEFLAWAEEKKAEIKTWRGKEEAEVDAWQEEKTEDFDAWVQDFVNKWESWLLGKTDKWQTEIIDWFDNLREQLTENAAVALQEQIGNLNNLKTDEKENLVKAINSLPLSYDETMAILAGVNTITVTLSANDGASLEGQTVTLLNVATGEEITKEYDPAGISFEIYEDIEYCLSVSDMEDYTTPDPVKILNIRGEDLEVQLEYKHLSFNDHSWARIAEIVESGRASEIFSLHDEKEVELTTGEKIVLEIADFNHDILASDTEKTAGITLVMKDCLMTDYAMNPTDTNVGGWADSKMRTAYIRENLYDVLPEDLKAVIKQVAKETAGNNFRSIVTTVDDVWLLSITELGWSNTVIEGTVYPIYETHTNMENIIKHRGPVGEAVEYFTRSPGFDYGEGSFRYVMAEGRFYYEFASKPLGLAAGLCI